MSTRFPILPKAKYPIGYTIPLSLPYVSPAVPDKFEKQSKIPASASSQHRASQVRSCAEQSGHHAELFRQHAEHPRHFASVAGYCAEQSKCCAELPQCFAMLAQCRAMVARQCASLAPHTAKHTRYRAISYQSFASPSFFSVSNNSITH
jgi:hypothetical protein